VCELDLVFSLHKSLSILFSPLLATNLQLVSQTAAIANPTIDSALYISLSKLVPTNIRKMLPMGKNNKAMYLYLRTSSIVYLYPNLLLKLIQSTWNGVILDRDPKNPWKIILLKKYSFNLIRKAQIVPSLMRN